MEGKEESVEPEQPEHGPGVRTTQLRGAWFVTGYAHNEASASMAAASLAMAWLAAGGEERVEEFTRWVEALPGGVSEAPGSAAERLAFVTEMRDNIQALADEFREAFGHGFISGGEPLMERVISEEEEEGGEGDGGGEAGGDSVPFSLN